MFKKLLLVFALTLVSIRVAQAAPVVSAPVLSPDTKQFAYIESDSHGQSVVLNGKKQQRYEGVSNLMFSPDSKNFVYIGSIGSKQFIVYNGKEQEKTYSIISYPIFSPDSKQFAYVGSDSEGDVMVINGQEQKRYTQIVVIPTFSPDSKNYVYGGYRENGKTVLVSNGEEQEVDGEACIKNIIFSADSKQWACVSYNRSDDKEFMILNGQEQEKFSQVYDIIFSADSKQYAYMADNIDVEADTRENFIILNGNKEKTRYYYFDGSLVFSPDFKQSAYGAEYVNIPCNGGDNEVIYYGDVAGQCNRGVVVLNGNEMQVKVSLIGNMVFSPDSKQFAFIAFTKNEEYYAIVNGVKQKVYNKIFNLKFSPDSKQVAYVASAVVSNKVKVFAVINGHEQQKYDYINDIYNAIVFSPNSKHVAYIAKNSAGKMFVVVDGKNQPAYSSVLMAFAPNSKQLVYLVQDKNTITKKVINLQ